MQKTRVNIWLTAETIAEIKSFASDHNLNQSKAINFLLADALSRASDAPSDLDPKLLTAFEDNLGTLISRTYYLVVATNVLLKHHPEADLKKVVDEYIKEKKGQSNG